MRLAFDNGTLLVTEPSPPTEASSLPGVLWDARIGAHRCPAFRYPDVLSALRTRGAAFTNDIRAPSQLAFAESPSLRPYQEAALASWELAGRRGVVVLPTGSGKTRVALAAIARAGVATLCLVPTRVLLDQWSHEVEAHLGIAPGRQGDGERTLGAITVATFESAWRHMGSIGDRFGLLIVDECHHFGHGARDEALELSCAPWRLGLTATPSAPGTRLEELVGAVVFRVAVRELAGSYLAPFEVVTLHLALDDEERRRYLRSRAIFSEAFATFLRSSPGSDWVDFTRAAVRTDVGRRALAAFRETRELLAFPRAKRAALALLLERHREERTLVFTADNATCYAVAREHLVMPFTCDIGRAERTRALEHFRAGRLRALVSAQVLNEGLDVPDAQVGIVVAGRRGAREHVQRLGRILRAAPGKRALLYELIVRGTADERDAAVRGRSLEA